MNDTNGPENLRYGGTVAAAHPVYILAMLLAGLLILFLRREKAIYPLIIVGLILPYGQAVTVFSAHFQMLRFLILFGWTRMLWSRLRNTSGEDRSQGLHPIDKACFAMVERATRQALRCGWGGKCCDHDSHERLKHSIDGYGRGYPGFWILATAPADALGAPRDRVDVNPASYVHAWSSVVSD